MFGMSSEEFWEGEPQLYWAYRTFYIKKIEQEQKIETENMKRMAWLNGNMASVAVSIALANTLSKGQKTEFPTYTEVFGKEEKKAKKEKVYTKKEIDKKVSDEFNSWARY